MNRSIARILMISLTWVAALIPVVAKPTLASERDLTLRVLENLLPRAGADLSGGLRQKCLRAATALVRLKSNWGEDDPNGGIITKIDRAFDEYLSCQRQLNAEELGAWLDNDGTGVARKRMEELIQLMETRADELSKEEAPLERFFKGGTRVAELIVAIKNGNWAAAGIALLNALKTLRGS